jgi:hypothetical protein
VLGPAIADAEPASTVAVASKAMPAVRRPGLTRRGGAVLRRAFGWGVIGGSSFSRRVGMRTASARG